MHLGLRYKHAGAAASLLGFGGLWVGAGRELLVLVTAKTHKQKPENRKPAAVGNIFLYVFDRPPGGSPFSWGVTPSGGPPGGRSLSKDGTRADSAKDFCCV